MKEAFDLTSEAEERAALASAIVLSLRMHRDDGLHPACANGIDDPISVISRIRDEGFACRVRNEIFRLHRVMLLAGRQRDVERLALGRRDGVQLG